MLLAHARLSEVLLSRFFRLSFLLTVNERSAHPRKLIAAIHTRNSSISFNSSKTVFLVGCNEQILTSNYIQCLRRLFFKEQLYRQFS